jgi:hypothetical protein
MAEGTGKWKKQRRTATRVTPDLAPTICKVRRLHNVPCQRPSDHSALTHAVSIFVPHIVRLEQCSFRTNSRMDLRQLEAFCRRDARRQYHGRG